MFIATSPPKYELLATCKFLFKETSLPTDKRLFNDKSPFTVNCWLNAKLLPKNNRPFIDTSPWNTVWPPTWIFLFNETSLVTASLPFNIVSLPTIKRWFNDTSPRTVSRWFSERSPWINSLLLMETSEPKYTEPSTWRTLFIDTSFNVVLPPITNLWFIETSPITVRRWFKDTSPWTNSLLPIETSEPK